MPRRFAILGLAIAMCSAGSGCATPGVKVKPDPLAVKPTAPASAPATSTASATSTGAATNGSAATGTTTASPPTATASTTPTDITAPTAAKPATPDPKALADVIAELQTLGALEPDAQTRLMEDLKQTDPSLWPQMVQAFRASLAYRKQMDERSRLAADGHHHHPDAALAADAGVPNTPAVAVPANRLDPKTAARLAQLPAVEDVALAPTEPPQQNYPSTGQPAATLAPHASVARQAPPVNPAPTAQPAAAEPLWPMADPPATAVPVVYRTPAALPDNWPDQLAATIATLERDLPGTPTTVADINRHAALRMLYLVAGRRDDALRPIAGIPPAQQDFWAKEIYGLASYLDSQQTADPARRAAEAATYLQSAAERLSDSAALVVHNLEFCAEVSSYGVYKKFDKNDFKPEQAVILYAEVDNFKSEPTDKGFHTALRSSYEILDSHGNRVAQQDFPTTEEFCQNARRDFFIRFVLRLPKKLGDGAYTLQLTLEDTQSQKIAQSAIQFTIRDGGK